MTSRRLNFSAAQAGHIASKKAEKIEPPDNWLCVRDQTTFGRVKLATEVHH